MHAKVLQKLKCETKSQRIDAEERRVQIVGPRLGRAIARPLLDQQVGEQFPDWASGGTKTGTRHYRTGLSEDCESINRHQRHPRRLGYRGAYVIDNWILACGSTTSCPAQKEAPS